MEKSWIVFLNFCGNPDVKCAKALHIEYIYGALFCMKSNDTKIILNVFYTLLVI